MAGVLRIATRADVAGIQRVRGRVREDRLVSRVISDEEVIEHLETLGHGWVVEDADEMVTWMFGQGLESLWLTTEPGTRAEGFYRRAGWGDDGLALRRPRAAVRVGAPGIAPLANA